MQLQVLKLKLSLPSTGIETASLPNINMQTAPNVDIETAPLVNKYCIQNSQYYS